MNPVILIALLLPLATFGQKIELSEQAGYSVVTNDYQESGFSNQFMLSYRPVKRISVGAFYEYTAFKSRGHGFGISADYITKHIYAGVTVKEVMQKTLKATTGSLIDIKYDPSLGCGVHVGARQQLIRNMLYLTEQASYDVVSQRGTIRTLDYNTYYTNGNYNRGFTGDIFTHSYAQKMSSYSFRIGLVFNLTYLD